MSNVLFKNSTLSISFKIRYLILVIIWKLEIGHWKLETEIKN